MFCGVKKACITKIRNKKKEDFVKMAPVPAEIDLFTIPHSRMKELVNTYTEKVQCVDFRDCNETFTLLKELQATFYEFKSHECIENLFIMDQLKNRLKQRHIYNSAVCDCHNDNRLAQMMNLVNHGKQLLESSICERLNFGEELQKCFFDFVKEFLPHMEEEENIFQPLLVEHFEYDELRVLKEAVIEQHELLRDPLYQEKAELELPETDSSIKDLRDIDCDVWSPTDLCQKASLDKVVEEEEDSVQKRENPLEQDNFVLEQEEFLEQNEFREDLVQKLENPLEQDNFILEQEEFLEQNEFREDLVQKLENPLEQDNFVLEQEEFVEQNEFRDFERIFDNKMKIKCEVSSTSEKELVNLPSEILVKIFDLLTPPDRGRCTQVCSYWNEVVYTPLLWKEIYPIQWARGIWTWSDANLNYLLEDEASIEKRDRDTSKYDEDADVDETEDVLPLAHQREYILFSSVISYLLPKIGRRVEKLVLDAGRGITSRQIRQALMLCPNVTHFSAGYTAFSYHSLKGFGNMKCLSKLRHLDLQGCTTVNDNCLYMLSQCLNNSKRSKRMCTLEMCINNDSQLEQYTEYFCPYYTSCCATELRIGPQNDFSPYNCPYLESYSCATAADSADSSDSEEETEIEELHVKGRTKSRLRYLNLSGCYEVTDQGLMYLLREGLLQNITYLNISSCFDVSGVALCNIIRQCRKLHPQNLSYCNNILNGPYPSHSNGCDNLSHPIKSCCQKR